MALVYSLYRFMSTLSPLSGLYIFTISFSLRSVCFVILCSSQPHLFVLSCSNAIIFLLSYSTPSTISGALCAMSGLTLRPETQPLLSVDAAPNSCTHSVRQSLSTLFHIRQITLSSIHFDACFCYRLINQKLHLLLWSNIFL